MRNMKTGLMAAMMMGLLAGAETVLPKHMRRSFRAVRPAKCYPCMVTSSREEIAAHNAAVTTRQVRRAVARKARKGYFATTDAGVVG